MFSTVGLPGLFVILIAVLIVFGPKWIPEIKDAIIKTAKELRATKDVSNNKEKMDSVQK